MRVAALQTLGFRNLAAGRLDLGEGITLLWGPNGAGKTNVLEAICLALSGRSTRTRNEREAIAFGEPLARIEVEVTDGRRDARLPLVAGSVRGAPPPRRRQPRGGGARGASTAAGDLPARPAGAGQGPAGRAPGASGPPLRRALAGARRSSASLRAGARPAERALGPGPVRRRAGRFAGRLGAGAGDGGAGADHEPARGRRLAGSGVRRGGCRALPAGRRRASLSAAQRGRPTRGSWRRSFASAATRIWRAATRPTGRTWTSWRSRSTGARCAATARRGSNARRCWRCSSPSAAPCSRRVESRR